MNIQQTLERLAVVAGDWIQIERDDDDVIGIYIQRKGTMRKCLRIGGIDEDRVFGAICEKVQSEGWHCEMEINKTRPRFGLTIYTKHSCYHSKHSDTHPAHAAAQALLAALEAKARDSIKGLLPASNMIDTFLDDTGKQSNQQGG